MKKVTNQYVVYPPVSAMQAKSRRSKESMGSPRPPAEDHALIFKTRQLIDQYFERLQLPSKHVPEVLYWREIW
ncbi:hypothetical protein TNCV_4547061 [Trichonephila clavipes]|nr:hypothetical protein TNCV_4547061 [Trichonephila clavipes]